MRELSPIVLSAFSFGRVTHGVLELLLELEPGTWEVGWLCNANDVHEETLAEKKHYHNRDVPAFDFHLRVHIGGNLADHVVHLAKDVHNDVAEVAAHNHAPRRRADPGSIQETECVEG